MKFYSISIMILSIITMLGCARLNQVQIGDIDNTHNGKKRFFSVKVSETGVSVVESTAAAVAIARDSQTQRNIGNLGLIISLFQMGPRTGNPVFVDTYADNLGQLLHEECPSGKITGIVGVREARKYPAISGEIINISGYCWDESQELSLD